LDGRQFVIGLAAGVGQDNAVAVIEGGFFDYLESARKFSRGGVGARTANLQIGINKQVQRKYKRLFREVTISNVYLNGPISVVGYWMYLV
jgi:hypothetical protein